MKWISVKERLPELGHDPEYPYASKMILLSDIKTVCYGQYEDSKDDDVCGFIDSNGNDFKDQKIKITHWMPLPEPPKSNQHGN